MVAGGARGIQGGRSRIGAPHAVPMLPTPGFFDGCRLPALFQVLSRCPVVLCAFLCSHLHGTCENGLLTGSWISQADADMPMHGL